MFSQVCRFLSILLVCALCVSLFSLSVSAEFGLSYRNYFEAYSSSARYGSSVSDLGDDASDSAMISYNTRSIAMLLSSLLDYVDGGLSAGISNIYSYQLSDNSGTGDVWEYSSRQFDSIAYVLLAITRNQVLSAKHLSANIIACNTSLSNIYSKVESMYSAQIAGNRNLNNIYGLLQANGLVYNLISSTANASADIRSLLQDSGSVGQHLVSISGSVSGMSQVLDGISEKLPALSNFQYHYTISGDTLGYSLAAGQNGSFWHAVEMGLRTLNEQIYSEQSYLFDNSSAFSSGSFYTDVLNKLDSISSALANGSSSDVEWLKSYIYPDGSPAGYSYKVSSHIGNVTTKNSSDFFRASVEMLSGLNDVSSYIGYSLLTQSGFYGRRYYSDTYFTDSLSTTFPRAVSLSLGAIADLLQNIHIPLMNAGLFFENVGDELFANSNAIANDVLAIREVLANSKDSELDDASSSSVTNVTNIYKDYQPDSKFSDASSGLNSVLDGLNPGISVSDGLGNINNLFDSSSDVGNWGWFSSETRDDIDPSLADSSDSVVSYSSDIPEGQQIVWVLDSSYSWASLVG